MWLRWSGRWPEHSRKMQGTGGVPAGGPAARGAARGVLR